MSQLLVFGQTFDTAELRLRVIAFLLMITSLVCLIRIERAPPQPTNVRVAIVAHEDFREELTQRTRQTLRLDATATSENTPQPRHFHEIFAETSRRDPSLRFQLAVDSYGEVLHWMDRQRFWIWPRGLTPGTSQDC